MAQENWGPGRSGYAIAGVIFLVGTLIAAALFGFVVYNVATLDDKMDRIPIPGTSAVNLEDTGRYTVFYERQESMPERGFETSADAPGLAIEVTAVDTGEQVSVSESSGEVNYDFWSRSGHSVATFEIDEPGAYEIAADYLDDRERDEAMLVLGEGIGTAIVVTVLAALGSGAFFCGTIGVALIIVIITLIRRS